MIAKVVLNSNSNIADNLFDYLIPDSLSDRVSVGSRVKVPFGNGNKTSEAFVYMITESSEYTRLKSIHDLIDDYTYFNQKSVELVEFMRHRYFCTYISALKCVIPSGINIKFEEYITLVDDKAEDGYRMFKNSVTASRIIGLL